MLLKRRLSRLTVTVVSTALLATVALTNPASAKPGHSTPGHPAPKHGANHSDVRGYPRQSTLPVWPTTRLTPRSRSVSSPTTRSRRS